MSADRTLTTAPKASRIGRALRACAGVDELVLDRCHWERGRYSGIGGAVLGTAAVAAFSMGLAIATMTESFGALCLLAAFGWGVFVFNLDRWMVASTHGLRGKVTLLPRVALALVFGFIIAEPVVLTVFASAVETHIADSRREEADDYEALLARCNPADPTQIAAAAALPACAEARLNVDPPEAQADRLADLGRQRDLARRQLDALQADLTETRERLQRERVGEQGSDTSGRRGVGPIARGLEADVARLTAERDDAHQRFDRLHHEYQELAKTSEGSTTSYGDRASAAIASRAAAQREKLDRKPGLLERMDALHELTGEQRHLFAARWFLTAFFVAIDSLPVLVKMLSGTSTYDRLVHTRLATSERLDRHAMRIEEESLVEGRDLERLEQQQDALARREQIRLVTRRRLSDLDEFSATMEPPPTTTTRRRPPQPAPRAWHAVDDGDGTEVDLAAFLAVDDRQPQRRGGRRGARPNVDDIVPNGRPRNGKHVSANGSASAATLLDDIRTFRAEGGWDEFHR